MNSDEKQLQLLIELENNVDMCDKAVAWIVAQIKEAQLENTSASALKIKQFRSKLAIEKKILDKYDQELKLIS